MAVASYLTNDHAAAVDTNAHAGPIWMSRGQASNPALKCQGGTRCSLRMIGLVSSAVERGHDAVSGELLDISAELTRDQRRCDAPVRVEHGRRRRR